MRRKVSLKALVNSALQASRGFRKTELGAAFREEMAKPATAMESKPRTSQDIKAEIKSLEETLRYPKRSRRFRALVKEYDEVLMQECFAGARQSLIADMESGKIPHPDEMVRQMYEHNPNPIF